MLNLQLLRLRCAVGSQARPGLRWGGVCGGASCVHSVVQVWHCRVLVQSWGLNCPICGVTIQHSCITPWLASLCFFSSVWGKKLHSLCLFSLWHVYWEHQFAPIVLEQSVMCVCVRVHCELPRHQLSGSKRSLQCRVWWFFEWNDFLIVRITIRAWKRTSWVRFFYFI